MEDFFSILFVVVFLFVPILFGKKKKAAVTAQREVTHPIEREEVVEFAEQSTVRREKISSSKRANHIESVRTDTIEQNKDKIDKKKLIIYSEVLKPKFKEF